jgi:hypothetical protein
MGLFSKFHYDPERAAQNVPGSSSRAVTEMTNFSELPSCSRLRSSGTSILSFKTTNSAQLPYSSRKAEKGWVQDINKHNFMAKHLYRNCKRNNWLEENSNEAVIALRTFQGGYILFPPEDRDEVYEKAIKGLNVEVSQLYDWGLTLGLHPS